MDEYKNGQQELIVSNKNIFQRIIEKIYKDNLYTNGCYPCTTKKCTTNIVIYKYMNSISIV